MKPILILQSCAPNAPSWVRECMQSVKAWSEMHGHRYIAVGDELFLYAKDKCRAPFNNVTRSDICRLALIQARLALDWYRAVVWIDSDFLIWNKPEFVLPECEPCSVICAREAFVNHDGTTKLAVNNSVLGFCNLDDVAHLMAESARILDEWRSASPPKMTIIGTDFFSSRAFPLRQIQVKSAGCFSEATMNSLLAPDLWAERHYRHLALAHGGDLFGANLCSSRGQFDHQMQNLIEQLRHVTRYYEKLGRSKYLSPAYRIFLRAVHFAQRVRCWTLTRLREFRTARSGIS